jgi:hypothetical protein
MKFLAFVVDNILVLLAIFFMIYVSAVLLYLVATILSGTLR